MTQGLAVVDVAQEGHNGGRGFISGWSLGMSSSSSRRLMVGLRVAERRVRSISTV